MMADMKRFYFDTVLSSIPFAMPSLFAFADPSHITFGSDFPFVPDAHPFCDMLDKSPLNDKLRHAINRGNAEVLFPRLAQTN
jgi:predicted TIM-barrel fold metal-dependent hydrolase